MTLHFGATLRLLRLESGLGLRDLARRLGVSSAYLSRVENGRDPAPTPERLAAMARELGVSTALLVELAQRVSPFLLEYIEQVPDAGSLFLEIAHRRLGPEQLAAVRELIDERFVARGAPAAPRGLSALLAPERVIVRLACAGMDDLFAVVAGRLVAGAAATTLATALIERERDVSSAIGGGVAVPCATVAGRDERAAVVTLASPLACDTPDGAPLRVVIVLAGPAGGSSRRAHLVQIARLAARGLADDLAELHTPAQVLARLASLDGLFAGRG